MSDGYGNAVRHFETLDALEITTLKARIEELEAAALYLLSKARKMEFCGEQFPMCNALERLEKAVFPEPESEAEDEELCLPC